MFVPSGKNNYPGFSIRVENEKYQSLAQALRAKTSQGYTVKEVNFGAEEGVKAWGNIEGEGQDGFVYQALSPTPGGQRTIRVSMTTDEESAEEKQFFDLILDNFSVL